MLDHPTWQTFQIDRRFFNDPETILLLFRILIRIVIQFSGFVRIFTGFVRIFFGFHLILDDGDDGAVDVRACPDDRNFKDDVVASVPGRRPGFFANKFLSIYKEFRGCLYFNADDCSN